MLFITGTDTSVGKTYFSCLLLRHLRANSRQAVGFKPICCGDRDDAVQLTQASDDALTVNQCNPIWMRYPAAPYTSSIIEERFIDLREIRFQWELLRAQFPSIIVEGAGGWLVPVHRDYSMADLARELALPVVLVAVNRLGVLNHTLLTLESIRSMSLTCAGVVLNDGPLPREESDTVSLTNRSVLEDLLRGTGVPVLGELNCHDSTLPDEIARKLTVTF